MTVAKKLLSSAGGAEDKLYVDDVFSTYLYTGNGATGQTIVNGIDLAGEGGMVWTKSRNATGDNTVTDTVIGATKRVVTNNTAAELISSGIFQFNNNGFSLLGSGTSQNNTGDTYASWTFRRSPKFFDVVTYTGDGVAGRQIPHNLGCEVGLVMVKRLDATGSWTCHHRTLANDMVIRLESNAAQSAANSFMVKPTDTYFTVNSWGEVNTSGGTYVAYLFAHDPEEEDGIIQCGSFTSSATALNITLGWEPQYLLWKHVNSTSDWYVMDNMRGWDVDRTGNTVKLSPNLSSAEQAYGTVGLTATGFTHTNGTAGADIVYMAIRRSNKPPESGSEVYNAIARTGTGSAATVTGVEFAPDLVISKFRTTTGEYGWNDRLRGALKSLFSNSTAIENRYFETDTLTGFDISDGIRVGSDGSVGYINNATKFIATHFFRRAPGVFDEVCYTGYLSTSISHNLGVIPELMIIKNRGNAVDWAVYHKDVSIANPDYMLKLNLNLANTFVGANLWGTNTVDTFHVSDGWSQVNANGQQFTAYLFATLAGISKVGSYTGNGTSQTIDCGFSTGARFVLCKRTDNTGDWFVWNSVTGITAGNDPHLSLNTTAAEVTTDDSVDPESSGFIVNQNTATNINVSGGSYIFLSIA